MALKIEQFPQDQKLPPDVAKRLQQYNRLINRSSNDVIRQAGLYIGRGKLYADNGYHAEAIYDFDNARQRYLIDGLDENGLDKRHGEISEIESLEQKSFRALSEKISQDEAEDTTTVTP